MSQQRTYDDRQYGDLATSATTDPAREPAEQETSFGFDKDRDRATVYCAYSALMKRFLLHPEFELDWYETNADDAPSKRIEADEYAEDGHDRRKPVYAIHGTIPIACLKVRPRARQSGGPASVVSASVKEEGWGDD